MNLFNVIFFIFLFLLGLSIGSFINAVVYRLKTGRRIIRARSICPKCKKKLGFVDLIPLISFIMLRGRCRTCRQKISWQYPLVELATGIIFVLIFYYQILVTDHWSPITFIPLLFYLFIAVCLIAIFVYDLKYSLIPDRIIWPAIIVNLVYAASAIILYLLKYKEIFYRLYPHTWPEVYNPWYILYGVLIGGGFFLILVLVSRGRWMGGGDIKLGILMGLLLGYPLIILALMIAFVTGAICGLILIALKKKTMKSQIPFGPFLIAATFISLFWGAQILNWYLGALLK